MCIRDRGNRTRQKNKRGDSKVESNDSPETPDRRETSDIPSLPSGAEKEKTERITGLGRRTKEEIAKWNQMTALRFQTGGRHQTSPASLRGQNTKFSRSRYWK